MTSSHLRSPSPLKAATQLTLAVSAAFAVTLDAAAAQATLVGRAVLPAATFSAGPTSGQFTTGANGIATPFADLQPVQGVSAVLDGPVAGTFYVMSDNGFGSKANSPDYVLRVYAVKPDFVNGTVSPVHFGTGVPLPSYTSDSYITLRDPGSRLAFPIVADGASYPGTPVSVPTPSIPVDPAIARGRLLTGWDLDIESFRRTPDGAFWFGDEFGPFLVKTDATGAVERDAIPLPNVRGLGSNPFVQAPQNPSLTEANLATSRGFEGMALNKSGTKLYTLLEGSLTTDPDRRRLLINEFDLVSESYTAASFAYRMEAVGHAIGDFTAVTDTQYLVIERDGRQGDPTNPAFANPAAFKKIYLVDLGDVDSEGFVRKTELVDLLNIADPRDLDGNGDGRFTFPFVTIESVLMIDPQTLLVVNDNNFPFSVGRTPGVADNTEFILVQLSQPIPEPETYALMSVGLAVLVTGAARRRRLGEPGRVQ
jgi:hypothetical protein